MGNKLAGAEAEALGQTLGDVQAEALVDMLGVTLAKEKSETLHYTLGDVEHYALVDTLADFLAGVEVDVKTLGDTLIDEEAETLVDAVADTLTETEAGTLCEKWAMWRPTYQSTR